MTGTVTGPFGPPITGGGKGAKGDTGATGAGSTIIVQDEGVALTARANVNFIGTAVTAVDNAGAARTDVTVSAVPTSRLVSSGTGLTGGGDLSADRTLAVSYGTSAGTAAQGNDARITGAVQAASPFATLVKFGTLL